MSFNLKKLTSLISVKNKFLNKLYKKIDLINKEYSVLDNLTDEEILEKSLLLKTEITEKLNNYFEKNKKKGLSTKETFIELLDRENSFITAVALLKEVIKREYNIELYDVQLLGGLVLSYSNIAEIKTGEGKTFIATIPTYIQSLTSHQIHVVTANNYLAQRDSETVEKIFKRLGVTVGCNTFENKKEQYEKDVVYGTSHNFGFDFLRDRSAFDLEDILIKERFFAIIDEADSILIDEARTPLIISQPNNSNEEVLFYLAKNVVQGFEVGRIYSNQEKILQNKKDREEGDFQLDLKNKEIIFTERGMNKITDKLIELKVIKDEKELFSPENLILFDAIQTAAKAEYAYEKDKDYLVENGKVFIINEMTGRVSKSQKWSKGLHQAIEAKENLEITEESKTVATTTLQHYFNGYEMLCGMTGTAITEEQELNYVYGLETYVIPTNKKIIRKDRLDRIFTSSKIRDEEFIKFLIEKHKTGQPILIGTNSVEENEYYSKLLKKHNLPHNMLNAKNHSQEAEIIAKAGELGSITLATNMAGRGTDIILGGNNSKQLEELMNNIYHSNQYKTTKGKKIKEQTENQHNKVKNLGGLLVISLGHNESRRVDNQLRGRSGRQGDVGESIFFVSLEDSIWKPFGIEKTIQLAKSINNNEDIEISNSIFNKQINKLQMKIEEFHFEQRKNNIEYSKVVEQQSDVFYSYRDEILKDEISIDDLIKDLVINFIKDGLNDIFNIENYYEFNENEIEVEFKNRFNKFLENFKNIEKLDETFKQKIEKINILNQNNGEVEKVKNELIDLLIKNYIYDKEIVSKYFVLQLLDYLWIEHLNNLEHLRNSVHLSGYSGKDPKEIYKKEAFKMFEGLLQEIKNSLIKLQLNKEG